ncbi:hypothetical protein PG985_015094 [Apiospora marii]|uniref:Uncharacterized protein n=1 Tax=Apiospora marii TaxID=335849 RepID=A0ABR1RM92_9PEZI
MHSYLLPTLNSNITATTKFHAKLLVQSFGPLRLLLGFNLPPLRYWILWIRPRGKEGGPTTRRRNLRSMPPPMAPLTASPPLAPLPNHLDDCQLRQCFVKTPPTIHHPHCHQQEQRRHHATWNLAEGAAEAGKHSVVGRDATAGLDVAPARHSQNSRRMAAAEDPGAAEARANEFTHCAQEHAAVANEMATTSPSASPFTRLAGASARLARAAAAAKDELLAAAAARESLAACVKASNAAAVDGAAAREVGPAPGFSGVAVEGDPQVLLPNRQEPCP